MKSYVVPDGSYSDKTDGENKWLVLKVKLDFKGQINGGDMVPFFVGLKERFPQGLDLCGADGAFPIDKTIPHRTALLRGYGNAIIPPLAAVFVRSVLEEIRES